MKSPSKKPVAKKPRKQILAEIAEENRRVFAEEDKRLAEESERFFRRQGKSASGSGRSSQEPRTKDPRRPIGGGVSSWKSCFLYLRRSKQLASPGPSMITAEEWAACVQDDSELLTLNPTLFDFAYWRNPRDGSVHALLWSEGAICVEDPDYHMIEKLLALAIRLNATIQNEQGRVCATSKEAMLALEASAIAARKELLHEHMAASQYGCPDREKVDLRDSKHHTDPAVRRWTGLFVTIVGIILTPVLIGIPMVIWGIWEMIRGSLDRR